MWYSNTTRQEAPWPDLLDGGCCRGCPHIRSIPQRGNGCITARQQPHACTGSLGALYTELFDGELTELVRRDILELAETETLLDLLRASALTGGRIDLTALNRLINTKQRLRASLGLGGPMPDASVPTIEEMLAQADEADA